MKSRTISIRTTSRLEVRVITGEIEAALAALGFTEGLCTILVPHTTAAIAINENADPDVPLDVGRALEKLVPDVRFRHGEGNSDAHFLSTLIGVSLTVPYRGRLLLGTWQGIYFIELDGPRTREVQVWVP
jgi:secondary thiamine-phosphate synthase enzyme